MAIPVRMSCWRVLMAVGLAAAPAPLAAQRAILSGRVTNQTQVPVRGALVALPGLRLSTETNDAGFYRLTIPADRVTGASDSLRVTRIGFRPQSVAVTLAAGETSRNFTLTELAVSLEDIIVTGTAGNQERRAQAATVSTVDVSGLTLTAPIKSVEQLLTGRVPGVVVRQSNGSVGSTSLVRIRGISSISLSNDPLIFVDGVRMDNANLFIAGGAVSQLNSIDPKEIETIEVVKGPAAATLYGADASTGVIQIITKRGRLGAQRFTQQVSAEYASTEAHWTPPANFAQCPASLVGSTSPSSLCRGQTVGALVSDNPILREGLLSRGNSKEIGWQGSGGGPAFGYFLSYNYADEVGTVPQNGVTRHSARMNFTALPHAKVTITGGVGLTRDINDQINVGDNFYGLLTALLGNPITVGLPVNGWFLPNITGASISSIVNRIRTIRVLPNVTIQHRPAPWFSHRLVLGADLARLSSVNFFPKNDQSQFIGNSNLGQVTENRNIIDTYTADYLANFRRAFGKNDRLTADLSFGSQVIARALDAVSASGYGLTANSSNVINSTTTISATGTRNDNRSVGVLGQLQLGYKARLYAQFGARIDQNSSFGDSKHRFFLPKVGVSWVLSDEPFMRQGAGFVNTLRLRAAYGTTGRSPNPGSALQTLGNAPFVLNDGSQAAGVIPLNPGNANLKAERGTEFEGGFDAGFLRDRVGLEVTYFNKISKNLILARPIPPSLGFSANPFVNIGEVQNKGVEVGLTAAVITGRRVALDTRFTLATLHNELTSLGGISPIVTGLNGGTQYREGRPLGSFFSQRVNSVDLTRGVAVVSDTNEFGGNPTPTYAGTVSSDLTLFGTVRISGLLEFRGGHKLFNVTEYFREKGFTSSERVQNQASLPVEERIRLFGPYVNSAGQPVPGALVVDDYIQNGRFARLRELSATYSLPNAVVRAFRMSNAQLTLGARNLALWTSYRGGWDPESITYVPNNGNGIFFPLDFLTMPQPRRFYVKLTTGF